MSDKISKIIDIKVLGTDKLHQLEKAITDNEKKLKSMTNAGKKNAGMQKIHQKNIVNTKLQLKQLRSERNLESKAIINQATVSKKLDGSYNSLVARNKALLTSMKATKGGMNSKTKAMQEMKAEYKANNDKLKSFDQSIGNNQRNVGNYTSALGGMKDKFASIGMAVGGAIVAFQAISRVITVVSADFGRFEKGLTNVLSLMNTGDIERFGTSLKEGTLDVMKEFGLQIDDVNKALFDAVSAGVPAADAVGFLETASRLAVGGVTDLTTATDGITTVLNAFGLEASEAEQVASAFFTAQKFGKTTVEELSNSIGQVAPIAKQAGLGYQELLSAMAVLTKQGLNTNISTSTLRATISALMKPAEGARKEFDRLGISYGASGLQADGLMKIMGQISKAAEEDVDALAKLIPNVQALTGVGALGTAQLADYDAILQQVNMDYGESSSLSEAVVMQQETLEQAQARLNAEWTAQKVLLGEELKPIFANVINTMSTLISHAQTIGRVLKSGAVAWGTYQVGVVAANVIQKVMNGTITQATIKQKALNLAVKANPYVLFASLLAGAVAMLWDSAEATEAAATEQDRYTKTLENLDNIQIRADEHLDTEIAKLNILNDTILSETSSRQQKQAAIDTMNDKYGTTLQFMSDEAGMAKQLEGAYNGAMAALKAKIVLQASQEQLLEVTKEQMALEEELFTLTGLRGDVQTVLNDAEKEYTRLQGVKTQMQDDWMEQNKRDSDEIWWQYEERMRRSLAEEAQYENVNKQLMNYSIGTHAATNKITVMSEKQRVLQEKIASATAELNKYLQTNKKDTKVEMDKTSVYAMSEDTLNQIALKKKELTRLMRDENRGSEEYIKLEKEIARLTALTTQAKVVKTQTIQDAIAKQTEEVAGLKKNMDMLKGKKGVEEEAGQVKVKWAQESIRLILLEAEANANLSEDQLARIAKLKEAIADVQNSSLSDDGGRASLLTNMFGEDGGAAVYDTTMQSLQAIGGLISANNALAEAESNQKLKVLEKERKDEKKMLKESAKWETMNDEEKRKALEDIDKKYDDKKAIIEEEAFNRNKKVQRQQAIISGAMAIMRIAADVPKLDFGIMTGLLIAAQIAMTAMQLQAIDATKYVKSAKGMIIPKFEKGGIAQGGSFKRGGMFSGPSHATGGIKFSQGGHIMEAEGGEAIINKASTAMYRNELSAINQAGGGIAFADGGIVNAQKLAAEAMTRDMLSATDIARISESLTSQEVVMVESEVTGTQRTVGIQESRASF